MIRAISAALPVTSNATRSVGARLAANASSAAGVVSIRPTERVWPTATIATSQEVAMHVHPDRSEHHLSLLVVDDAQAQVGKRHRRIRAHGTTGPVAGTATENTGLAAHQS
jgi:hypothetical protein